MPVSAGLVAAGGVLALVLLRSDDLGTEAIDDDHLALESATTCDAFISTRVLLTAN